MIRVLIADDHLLFRSMLEEMLKKDMEIEVVASCSDGTKALERCDNTIDLALLDIGMPNMNGIEALKNLKNKNPQLKVALLTTFEDIENIKSSIQYFADGYLIKDMTPDALISAIKCMVQGMVVFHKSAFLTLHQEIQNTWSTVEKRVQINEMIFDGTDIRILQQIVKGKSNKEIAHALSYSEGTIKNRITRLLSTTNASDRTELSVFAIKNHVI